MGNALPQHDDLVHVRGWTREQILGANSNLRRQKRMYALSKDEFARFFGGRHKEMVHVFNSLDTDYDGRVDIFEVLMVLTMWSGSSWDEKWGVLCEIFDLMGKGFLKQDEVQLLGSVLLNTLTKFVVLEKELSKPATIRDLCHKAMSSGGENGLSAEQLKIWVHGCAQLVQLKGFLEDHAPRTQPESQEGRMRSRMGVLEAHAQRLFESIERIQDRLPDFTNGCLDFVASLGRRKRWDFIMQNLRQLILSLQKASEHMHGLITELDISINEDEACGGTSSMINPERRFHQEQTLIELDKVRKQSSSDFREATELLRQLMQLAEPIGVEIEAGMSQAPGDKDTLSETTGAPGARVSESKARMQQVFGEMQGDMRVGGTFGFANEALASAAGASFPGEEGLAALLDSKGRSDGQRPPSQNSSMLVAVVDFTPPASHETQMLKLLVGDQITVLGQDGRGWWFGRKQNGKEGWFPPSYVQVKPAHFSSAA